MNLRQIRLVYFKEMKDILRDKRTVRLMFLVPVVVYPLMSFGFSALAINMANTQQALSAPIMMVGDAPELRAVFDEARDKVRLVPREEFIRDIEELDANEFAPAQRHSKLWQSDPYLTGISDSAKTDFYYSLLKGKVVDCVVEIPAGFEAFTVPADSVFIHIFYDEQEFRSDGAESKVRRLISEWRDSTSVGILTRAGLSGPQANHAMKPFWIDPVDVAPADKRTGFLLALMLPYMIVLMVLIGAMYPAIDLTAGEKERGTLETILASPAGRDEITIGKFLCVFTAAIVTVFLGAVSMTLTSGIGAAQMADRASGSFSTGSGFALAVNPASLALVILLMVPTAVLFSAALLAISVMARSFKEAQSYIQPLMILVILPSMVAFMPGIELNSTLALVPVANISLAVKAAMLTSRGEAFPWTSISIVFASTAVYAMGALFLVRQMFGKESVLFRT